MYDAIRLLIRENRIADALRAMDDLDLSREHASRLDSLHRRWRILEDKAMGNLIEERLIRIEENGIVEDVLKLLDHAEHPLPDLGADAGAITVSKTVKVPDAAGGKSRMPLYLGFGAVALAFLAWVLWPSPTPSPVAEDTPPAQEEPAKEEPTGTRPEVVLTDAARERLREAAAERISNQELRVDPSVLRRVTTAFMTSGEQVDVAVAVYHAKKSPTSHSAELSKSLSSYLDREWKKSFATDVLTETFHKYKDRERLQLRAANDANDKLKVNRARYLFL
ncbi:MAG: hypothetical protein AAFZ52_10960, partial [Bacteroidota bacterium]